MSVCRKYKRQICVILLILILVCGFGGADVSAMDTPNAAPTQSVMHGSTVTFMSGIVGMVRTVPVSTHFLAIGKAIEIPKSGSTGGIGSFFKGLWGGIVGLIKFIGKIVSWPFRMIFKFWVGVFKSFQTMYKMVKGVITFIQTLGKTIRAPLVGSYVLSDNSNWMLDCDR